MQLQLSHWCTDHDVGLWKVEAELR